MRSRLGPSCLPRRHAVTGLPDAVLLIDVENIIGQKAKPNLMAARVGVLIRQAGPGVRVVAACAKDRITEPSTHVLHSHNVTLLTVGATKNAADEALLAEAQALAHKGCRRFVVASNDSRFAQLADLGTLEIVVWKTQKTRPGYAARASRIHRLQCPPATTTPGVTGPAPTAAPQLEPSPITGGLPTTGSLAARTVGPRRPADAAHPAEHVMGIASRRHTGTPHGHRAEPADGRGDLRSRGGHRRPGSAPRYPPKGILRCQAGAAPATTAHEQPA